MVYHSNSFTDYDYDWLCIICVIYLFSLYSGIIWERYSFILSDPLGPSSHTNLKGLLQIGIIWFTDLLGGVDRANNHEGTQWTARHLAKCFWSGLLVGRCLRSSLRCRGGCGEGVAQGQLSSLFCFCPEFSCRYKRCYFFLPVLNYLRLLTQDSSPQYTRTINLDSMVKFHGRHCKDGR